MIKRIHEGIRLTWSTWLCISLTVVAVVRTNPKRRAELRCGAIHHRPPPARKRILKLGGLGYRQPAWQDAKTPITAAKHAFYSGLPAMRPSLHTSDRQGLL